MKMERKKRMFFHRKPFPSFGVNAFLQGKSIKKQCKKKQKSQFSRLREAIILSLKCTLWGHPRDLFLHLTGALGRGNARARGSVGYKMPGHLVSKKKKNSADARQTCPKNVMRNDKCLGPQMF
eukprot:TRINITY_DN4605_c1_g1_i1.p1 TRINITY_DN4605_c1_g1~~TRINITY_DN4605_c1_g1_i1.p1  ORF type:complete len:123 (+),score=7.99 TRINITY_DN4605_c1_g1_i1:117-485(+)